MFNSSRCPTSFIRAKQDDCVQLVRCVVLVVLTAGKNVRKIIAKHFDLRKYCGTGRQNSLISKSIGPFYQRQFMVIEHFWESMKLLPFQASLAYSIRFNSLREQQIRLARVIKPWIESTHSCCRLSYKESRMRWHAETCKNCAFWQKL